jgi:hypothetical protein
MRPLYQKARSVKPLSTGPAQNTLFPRPVLQSLGQVVSLDRLAAFRIVVLDE